MPILLKTIFYICNIIYFRLSHFDMSTDVKPDLADLLTNFVTIKIYHRRLVINFNTTYL